MARSPIPKMLPPIQLISTSVYFIKGICCLAGYIVAGQLEAIHVSSCPLWLIIIMHNNCAWSDCLESKPCIWLCLFYLLDLYSSLHTLFCVLACSHPSFFGSDNGGRQCLKGFLNQLHLKKKKTKNSSIESFTVSFISFVPFSYMVDHITQIKREMCEAS